MSAVVFIHFSISSLGQKAQVPDFAARHERIKRQWRSRNDWEGHTCYVMFERKPSLSLLRLERRKYQNRSVTQPEPFVFNTPSRSQTRQAPMPKAESLLA